MCVCVCYCSKRTTRIKTIDTGLLQIDCEQGMQVSVGVDVGVNP